MGLGFGDDWDDLLDEARLKILERNIAAFREWVVKEIGFHNKGEMMSLAEAIHGEGTFRTVLSRFDKLFMEE